MKCKIFYFNINKKIQTDILKLLRSKSACLQKNFKRDKIINFITLNNFRKEMLLINNIKSRTKIDWPYFNKKIHK